MKEILHGIFKCGIPKQRAQSSPKGKNDKKLYSKYLLTFLTHYQREMRTSNCWASELRLEFNS